MIKFYVRDNNPDYKGLLVVERYVRGVREVARTFPFKNVADRLEAWRFADDLNKRMGSSA
jgi:hypothetical protein